MMRWSQYMCLALCLWLLPLHDVHALASVPLASMGNIKESVSRRSDNLAAPGTRFFGGSTEASAPSAFQTGVMAFAAGMGSLAVAQRSISFGHQQGRDTPPPPPPAPSGNGGGWGGDWRGNGKSGKKVKDPWEGNWWKHLPGGPFNPVYWWWKIKEGGPYTYMYINHVNPICKIVAFSSKKMLYLQILAMIGQISQILDKSWRPKLTEEHWWSIRYYSFFAVIHAIRIRSILQEQKPILLSAEEMEIFASVFQANQFTPRQFISLRKLARKKTARAHTLIKPSSVAMHSLILVISGTLEVEVRGHVTNHVGPGNFIGEVEFLSMEELNSAPQQGSGVGDRAQAEATGEDMSIRASENDSVTYLAWSFDELASLLRQSNSKQICVRFEALLAKQLANKLLETDLSLASRKKHGRAVMGGKASSDKKENVTEQVCSSGQCFRKS